MFALVLSFLNCSHWVGRGHIRVIFEEVLSQIQGLINNQISAVLEKTGKKPKVFFFLIAHYLKANLSRPSYSLAV